MASPINAPEVELPSSLARVWRWCASRGVGHFSRVCWRTPRRAFHRHLPQHALLGVAVLDLFHYLAMPHPQISAVPLVTAAVAAQQRQRTAARQTIRFVLTG